MNKKLSLMVCGLIGIVGGSCIGIIRREKAKNEAYIKGMQRAFDEKLEESTDIIERQNEIIDDLTNKLERSLEINNRYHELCEEES